MKYLFSILCLLAFCVPAKAQFNFQNIEDHDVFLDTLNNGNDTIFLWRKRTDASPDGHQIGKRDTLITRCYDTCYFVLHFRGRQGAVHFECRTLAGDRTLFTGQYDEHPDKMRYGVRRIDPVTGQEAGLIFFYPARAGAWRYYDDKGQLLREVHYACGVVQP